MAWPGSYLSHVWSSGHRLVIDRKIYDVRIVNLNHKIGQNTISSDIVYICVVHDGIEYDNLKRLARKEYDDDAAFNSLIVNHQACQTQMDRNPGVRHDANSHYYHYQIMQITQGEKSLTFEIQTPMERLKFVFDRV